MREEIVRLLQRQYGNYRNFLIDIDRAQEIEEQNNFNFRCLHCYCEADEIDSREFDMDTSVEDFMKNIKKCVAVVMEMKKDVVRFVGFLSKEKILFCLVLS